MVPGRPLYIDGISYWIPDLTQLRSTVADTLDVTMSAKVRHRLEQDAREYENSIPANASEVPASDTSIGRSTESTKKHKAADSTAKKRSEQREDNAEEKKRSKSSASDNRSGRDAADNDTGSSRESTPAAPDRSVPSRSAAPAKTQ